MISQSRLGIIFRMILRLSFSPICKLLLKFWRNGMLLAPNEIKIMISYFMSLLFFRSLWPAWIQNFQLSLIRLFELLIYIGINVLLY